MSTYTPGSVGKLLQDEVESSTSASNTKLQALFLQPHHKPSVTRKRVEQRVSKKPKTNPVGETVSSTKRQEGFKENSVLYRREASLRDAEPDTVRRHKELEHVRNPASAVTSTPPAETSDSHAEVSAPQANVSVQKANALRRIEYKTKIKEAGWQPHKRDKKQEERTVFVGNVALSVRKKALVRLFKTCGKIENIRLRSVPVAGLKLPRKASVILKQFHPSRQSANAYVVFDSTESAQKALLLNGIELEGLHIRVDLSSSGKKHDHKNSIFIGNLPFDVEDEALRKHFECCGDITNVRVIRDKTTGVGKGFGYITFDEPSSVSLALSLNNQLFKGRALRVDRSTQKPQPSKKSKETKDKPAQNAMQADNKKKKTEKLTPKSSAKVPDKDLKKKTEKLTPKSSAEVPDKDLKHAKKQATKPQSSTGLGGKKVLDHRKAKEQRKKKLKKKVVSKKKASLGQMLTNTKHGSWMDGCW